MSIDAVVGRIDQILAMEQDLLDPASTQSTAQTAYALPSTTSTDASAGTSFANALAGAQAQLAGGTATTGGSGLAAATSNDPRITAMVNEADSLLGKPYVFGGGHSGWTPSSGYDCSGFVSAVLHA
ncbi:MAG: hypothetical protein ABSG43_02040, partial [Solirubrobacteraceae bacterium]